MDRTEEIQAWVEAGFRSVCWEYLECSTCYALVREIAWRGHAEWHTKMAGIILHVEQRAEYANRWVSPRVGGKW